MTLRIPVPAASAGAGLMAFYYDAAKGTLEGIPTLRRGAGFLEVAVRHFSLIVVSDFQKELLEGGGGFDTFFEPEENGWSFVNYGSAVTDGNCAGMCIGAAYFYRNFSSTLRVSSHFDNSALWFPTPEIWQDDATALKFVSDQRAAEDIVHDAVVKLLEKEDTLRTLSCCTLTSYVVYTVRNTAVSHLRRQDVRKKHRVETESDWEAEDAAPGPEELAILAERRETLRRAWSRLDDGSRDLLAGKYILEKSDDEIAEELGCASGSVRMKLTRARRRLPAVSPSKAALTARIPARSTMSAMTSRRRRAIRSSEPRQTSGASRTRARSPLSRFARRRSSCAWTSSGRNPSLTMRRTGSSSSGVSPWITVITSGAQAARIAASRSSVAASRIVSERLRGDSSGTGRGRSAGPGAGSGLAAGGGSSAAAGSSSSDRS